ncbi:MAG: Crp/Fnr family transcriptional regulator, partial [Bdellovibrionales bacterium]|nr:Crp/Fnr family transcriptional regulator [Bdellovibrionales bacterium]
IAHEGDEDSPSFIVKSGRVALLKSSASGKDLTVALLPPGDIFSVAMALDGNPTPYTAKSHGETVVLRTPTDLLRSALSENPALYRELYEELALRMQRAHDFSLRLAHEQVDVRIASALVELAAEFGASKSGTKERIVIVTRQQLAQIAGTTPETAIRVTRAMEEDKILDLSQPSKIRIVDFNALLVRANENEQLQINQ